MLSLYRDYPCISYFVESIIYLKYVICARETIPVFYTERQSRETIPVFYTERLSPYLIKRLCTCILYRKSILESYKDNIPVYCTINVL